jgi:hypothetical protein
MFAHSCMYSNFKFIKPQESQCLHTKFGSKYNTITLHIYISFLVAEELKTEAREVKTEKPDTPRNMKPPPEKKPRLS